MATQDTSAFDAVLKDVYQGPIRDQLNGRTRLLNDFTKADIEQLEWEGRQVIWALRSARNQGVKAVAESGLKPAAGKQGYANLKIPMRFIQGHIELTVQVMKAARSNKGAFARAMESEQQGLVEDLSRQRNRMIAYFGNGALAHASGAMSGTTLNVDNPGGVVGTKNGVRFLKANQVIAIHAGNTDTIRGVRTISSVDSESAVTLDSTLASVADGDIVTLGAISGSTTEGSRNLEPMGLLGIVDSTTFVTTIHGLDRSLAANAFFRSTILSSVGALSPEVIQRGTDNGEEVGGEPIDCLYVHYSVFRELLKLAEADRRWVFQNQRAGFSPDAGLQPNRKLPFYFNGVEAKSDKDLPYGTILGVSRPHLFWLPESEGEWADEDGAILLRSATKADVYEGSYRVYENYASDKGNSGVRFDGVTATVTSNIFAD